MKLRSLLAAGVLPALLVTGCSAPEKSATSAEALAAGTDGWESGLDSGLVGGIDVIAASTKKIYRVSGTPTLAGSFDTGPGGAGVSNVTYTVTVTGETKGLLLAEALGVPGQPSVLHDCCTSPSDLVVFTKPVESGTADMPADVDGWIVGAATVDGDDITMLGPMASYYNDGLDRLSEAVDEPNQLALLETWTAGGPSAEALTEAFVALGKEAPAERPAPGSAPIDPELSPPELLARTAETRVIVVGENPSGTGTLVIRSASGISYNSALTGAALSGTGGALVVADETLTIERFAGDDISGTPTATATAAAHASSNGSPALEVTLSPLAGRWVTQQDLDAALEDEAVTEPQPTGPDNG